MRVEIEIDKLVLHGFDYQDHKRIGMALEHELDRLVKDNRVLERFTKGAEIPEIVVPSFSVPTDMNPRTIGIEVARSIFGERETRHSKTSGTRRE